MSGSNLVEKLFDLAKNPRHESLCTIETIPPGDVIDLSVVFHVNSDSLVNSVHVTELTPGHFFFSLKDIILRIFQRVAQHPGPFSVIL